MKINNGFRVIGLAIIVFAMLFVVGTALVQGPEVDNDGSEGLGAAEGSEEQEGIVLAQPPYTMNYQGYLTDNSGNPLDGQYDMVFQLYDDANAGSVEWGPETHNNVQVSDGLFQVPLGITVNMYPNDFDEALFLSVSVNGTTLAPRQPLRSVPYAFGLVPGAEVEGDPTMTNYGLRVDNTGTGTTDRGLYVSGEQYGIYAEEVGIGSDIGIFSPDFIRAKGYRSSSDSYLWVPATAAALYPSADCTLYPLIHGSVRLACSTAENADILIPITVPGVLYGQEVRVESIQVYYHLENAGSFINTTRLRKQTPDGSSDTLVYDVTDRTSTTPTWYTLAATGNYTLTDDSGPLNLGLNIFHDGNSDHDLYVGGVQVRLGHN